MTGIEKLKQRPLLLGAAGLLTFVCACTFCAFLLLVLPDPDPDPTGSFNGPTNSGPATTTVRYYVRVTSCARQRVVYYDGVEKSNVITDLWEHEFEAASGQNLALVVECMDDELFFEEAVNCTIWVENSIVAEDRARGSYPVAACSSSIP